MGRRTAAQTRDHVLRVAHQLFYWDGIRATGVDKVAAESGVAPTTLYRLFASKDDLVAAYVERNAAQYREWFTTAVESAGDDPRARTLAVFEALTGQVRPELCRGCPFLMTLSEFPGDVPAHASAVELKTWVREQFQLLARAYAEAAEIGHAEQLADRLTLVFEGVYASVQALGSEGPARQARALAEHLLDTAA